MVRRVVIGKPESIPDNASASEVVAIVKSFKNNDEEAAGIVDADVAIPNTPKEWKETRDDFIIKYASSGLTTKTVTKLVNEKAKDTRWQPVSENTVRKVIADHYKRRNILLRGVDGKENEQAMREALLEQQEAFLEKLTMTYNRHETAKTFKSVFEQVQLATLISTVRQQIIENRNWNDSRKNPLVQATSSSFAVNVFETSGEKMIVNGQSESIQTVLAHLKSKFENAGD